MNLIRRSQNSFPTRPNILLDLGRRLSLVIGILLLGYVGFVLAHAKLYQTYQIWRLHRAVQASSLLPSDSHPQASAEPIHTDALRSPIVIAEGALLGEIEIKRLGLAVIIQEGTADETLRKAAGHISGTALPGEAGNVALAAHRDTFFRPLRNIHKNDEITLTTVTGLYRYRVDSTTVVQPDDISVLGHTNQSILTLVTCYPFYYVGSAPQRFIVRAHRVPA
jgi:sortase A